MKYPRSNESYFIQKFHEKLKRDARMNESFGDRYRRQIIDRAKYGIAGLPTIIPGSDYERVHPAESGIAGNIIVGHNPIGKFVGDFYDANRETILIDAALTAITSTAVAVYAQGAATATAVAKNASEITQEGKGESDRMARYLDKLRKAKAAQVEADRISAEEWEKAQEQIRTDPKKYYAELEEARLKYIQEHPYEPPPPEVPPEYYPEKGVFVDQFEDVPLNDAEYLAEKALDAGEYAAERAYDAGKFAVETVGEYTPQAIIDALGATKDAAFAGASYAGETVGNAAYAVGNTLGGAASTASEIAGNAWSAASSVLSSWGW